MTQESSDRLKDRVVADDRRQVYAVNYSGTYAPMAELLVVNLFLHVTLYLRRYVSLTDIKTVFLNRTSDEYVRAYLSRNAGESPARIYTLKIVISIKRSSFGVAQTVVH